MLWHILTAALNHHCRHLTSTVINVLCLAFGLVSFAIAYGMVEHNRSSDLFHQKASRTYVLTQRGELGTMPLTGIAFAPRLKAEYPQLDLVGRATRGAEVAIASDREKAFATVSFADPEFLQIFDLEFSSGDSMTALQSENSAVIAEELARQLYGTSHALGRLLRVNNRVTVHITGVMKEPRQPSHISVDRQLPLLQFALLLSMDTREALGRSERVEGPPGNDFLQQYTFTYLVMPQDGRLSAAQVSRDLPAFVQRHMPSEYGQAVLGLRPVSEIGEAFGDFSTKRDSSGISSNAVTITLGILILAIACLNYANLASAQATTRSRELAVRRVVGASFRQIALQSYGEAFVLVLAAAGFAALLLPPMLRALEGRLGMAIGPILLESADFWVGTVLTIFVVALVASAYPILIAARIRPAQAMPSGRWPAIKRRTMRWLVGLQFVFASLLLITTSVIKTQNDYGARLWADETSDPVIVLANDLRQIDVDRELLQNELLREPTIRSVTALDGAPGRLFAPSSQVAADADPIARRWNVISPIVDYDFFETVGIRLVAGRTFDREQADDLGARSNVVIDRALAAQYGWAVPQDAIGQTIYVPASAAKSYAISPRRVIGVVENKPLFPLTHGSPATLYTLDPLRTSVLLVRISGEDTQAGLAAIDAAWNSVAPAVPLKRSFLDEEFAQAYRILSIYTFLVGSLAGLALLVAIMGLVGIATEAIAQRTFELGIRKTLGANRRQLLLLLLRDFSKPILVANAIAWPLGFIVAKGYGAAFVLKAPLTVTPFLLTLFIGLATGWLAVFAQSLRASKAPPSKALRYE